MPLTSKGHEIISNMKEQYGEKAGERVFYASRNKGTISGVDADLTGEAAKARDKSIECEREAMRCKSNARRKAFQEAADLWVEAAQAHAVSQKAKGVTQEIRAERAEQRARGMEDTLSVDDAVERVDALVAECDAFDPDKTLQEELERVEAKAKYYKTLDPSKYRQLSARITELKSLLKTRGDALTEQIYRRNTKRSGLPALDEACAKLDAIRKEPPRDWIRQVGKAAEDYSGADEMDGPDLAYSLYTSGVINEQMSVREASRIVAQHFVQQ